MPVLVEWSVDDKTSTAIAKLIREYARGHQVGPFTYWPALHAWTAHCLDCHGILIWFDEGRHDLSGLPGRCSDSSRARRRRRLVHDGDVEERVMEEV